MLTSEFQTWSMESDAGTVFLDTAYFNARVKSADQWHHDAVRWERRIVASSRNIVTTEFVLLEFANSMATVKHRNEAADVIDILRSSRSIGIVPASSVLFDAGLELYRRRPDKNRGLTDCASFVVTRERSLRSALTSDRHFQQAGFRSLLLED